MPITTEELESTGPFYTLANAALKGVCQTGPLLRNKPNLFGSPVPGLLGATHNQSIFIAEIKLAGIVRSGKTYK